MTKSKEKLLPIHSHFTKLSRDLKFDKFELQGEYCYLWVTSTTVSLENRSNIPKNHEITVDVLNEMLRSLTSKQIINKTKSTSMFIEPNQSRETKIIQKP